jgi:hypothetical protein
MSPIAKDVLRSIGTAVLLVGLVVAIVALGGCAELTQKPVAVQVKTVDAPRAIPVPCVYPTDIPPKTPTAMPEPGADAARKAAGASADLHNVVAENDKLRALLVPCTKGATP